MYSNSDTQWFLEVNQEMEEMRCISIRCHVPDLGPATAEKRDKMHHSPARGQATLQAGSEAKFCQHCSFVHL